MYKKVSDAVLTKEELLGAILNSDYIGVHQITNADFVYSSKDVILMKDDFLQLPFAIVVKGEKYTHMDVLGKEEMCFHFETPGIYIYTTTLDSQDLHKYNTLNTLILPKDILDNYDVREDKSIYSLDGKILYRIPDNVTEYIVSDKAENIYNFACTFSDLKNITIPKTVKTIGSHAFNCCSISTVYYESSAEDWLKIQIGEYNHFLLRATINYLNK